MRCYEWWLWWHNIRRIKSEEGKAINNIADQESSNLESEPGAVESSSYTTKSFIEKCTYGRAITKARDIRHADPPSGQQRILPDFPNFLHSHRRLLLSEFLIILQVLLTLRKPVRRKDTIIFRNTSDRYSINFCSRALSPHVHDTIANRGGWLDLPPNSSPHTNLHKHLNSTLGPEQSHIHAMAPTMIQGFLAKRQNTLNDSNE